MWSTTPYPVALDHFIPKYGANTVYPVLCNAYVLTYGARTSAAICLSLPEYSNFDTNGIDQFSHIYPQCVLPCPYYVYKYATRHAFMDNEIACKSYL